MSPTPARRAANGPTSTSAPLRPSQNRPAHIALGVLGYAHARKLVRDRCDLHLCLTPSHLASPAAEPPGVATYAKKKSTVWETPRERDSPKLHRPYALRATE